MGDSSVDLPRPSADEANVDHDSNGQPSSVAIPTEPGEQAAKRGHLKKSGLASSLGEGKIGYERLPIDKIPLDEVPVKRGFAGKPLDPVVGQRIREETGYLRSSLDEIKRKIEALEEVRPVATNIPWHTKILGGLKGNSGKTLPSKHVVDPVAQELIYQRQVVESELRWKPRHIEEQIKHNRSSRQLYNVMRFLGDQPSRELQDYYYDGGVSYPKEDDSYRRYSDSGLVLWDLSLDVAQAGGYNGKVIILYDTSEPRAQMTAESFVDTMLRFGFALDETSPRLVAAMQADTGLDPEALNAFRGGDFGSDNSYGRLPDEKEWLHVSSDGKSANGLLHIEGDQGFDPEAKNSDSPGFSPALSKLCREWGIPHLSADLIYTRIPTSDVSIVVEFRNPAMVSVENPPVKKELLPGLESLPAGLKNVTPQDSE